MRATGAVGAGQLQKSSTDDPSVLGEDAGPRAPVDDDVGAVVQQERKSASEVEEAEMGEAAVGPPSAG